MAEVCYDFNVPSSLAENLQPILGSADEGLGRGVGEVPWGGRSQPSLVGDDKGGLVGLAKATSMATEGEHGHLTAANGGPDEDGKEGGEGDCGNLGCFY